VEYHRKQAKALVRAYRAGEPDALRRVDAVLGERARSRFLLSDAQHVIAREQGHRSWPELRRAETEVDERIVEPGPAYTHDSPVRVLIRRRHHRYDIGDLAGAVELAGRRPGWLDVARRVVGQHNLNVNRRGVVFVPAVAGRDIESLARRVAHCSLDLYQQLVELGPE
jgi:hypothetical protein